MENVSHITFELADRIAAAVGGTISHSRQSASAYVEVAVESEFDANGEATDWAVYCIRISDHEARSYNRAGNYSIGVGATPRGDTNFNVRAEWVGEEVEREIEIEDVDDEGNDITRTTTEIDIEHHFEFDAAAMNDAVVAAVAAVDRFKARFLKEQ